jgi:hypothetical protein
VITVFQFSLESKLVGVNNLHRNQTICRLVVTVAQLFALGMHSLLPSHLAQEVMVGKAVTKSVLALAWVSSGPPNIFGCS